MAATTKTEATQQKESGAPPREAMSLQEKFVKLREAVPSITQKQHSDGVKYKFAKIFDVYELLTPAMNKYGVNFDIVARRPPDTPRTGISCIIPASCSTPGTAIASCGCMRQT